MNTVLIIVIVAAIALVAVAAATAPYTSAPYVRSRRLKRRFGPEYARVIAEHEDRRAGERELLNREARHRGLELRAIPPEQRRSYAEEWAHVQERFVDEPRAAVETASALAERVIRSRGYGDDDPDRRIADLSVAFPAGVAHYRAARDLGAGRRLDEASTEELRTAIVHYRALLRALVPLDPSPAGAAPPGSTPVGAAAGIWHRTMAKPRRALQRARAADS